MFDDLPRHTLIQKKNGGIFLIKAKIYEWHGGVDVPSYIGHLYKSDGVDYEPSSCYINDIECVLEDA